MGVQFSSQKHPLSQNPLRQGQAPGYLGPFRALRTLGLPGAFRLGDLKRAQLPVAASRPSPRFSSPEALKWATTCIHRSIQGLSGPQSPDLAGRTCARSRQSLLLILSTSRLSSSPSPASLLPFSLLCFGPPSSQMEASDTQPSSSTRLSPSGSLHWALAGPR